MAMARPDPFRSFFGTAMRTRVGWDGKPLDRFWRSVSDCCYNALSGEGPHAPDGPRPASTRHRNCTALAVYGGHRQLSPQQWRLLGLIRGMLGHSGRAPTYREMREHMGWAGDAQVTQTLQALERKGRIRRPRRGVVELVEMEGDPR